MGVSFLFYFAFWCTRYTWAWFGWIQRMIGRIDRQSPPSWGMVIVCMSAWRNISGFFFFFFHLLGIRRTQMTWYHTQFYGKEYTRFLWEDKIDFFYLYNFIFFRFRIPGWTSVWVFFSLSWRVFGHQNISWFLAVLFLKETDIFPITVTSVDDMFQKVTISILFFVSGQAL